MVSSNESEEATQTVTTYLHKAFGFEDVFLGLIHREEGVLEGMWTRKTGGSHATLPFRVPLLGAPESVVVKSVWQHRPFVIHDARLHPPFTAAPDSTLADVLELVDGYAVVPLQRSRTLLSTPGCADTCDRDCPFGPAGKGTWYPPPGADGAWQENRDRARRRCLDCPQFPILGVLGVGCRRSVDLASVETALLESIALSVAPGGRERAAVPRAAPLRALPRARAQLDVEPARGGQPRRAASSPSTARPSSCWA